MLSTHFTENLKLIKKNKAYLKQRIRTNIMIFLPLYWLNSIVKINKVSPLSSATNLNHFRNYATVDKFWCFKSCQAQTPSSEFLSLRVCTCIFVPVSALKMTVNIGQRVCTDVHSNYKSNNSYLSIKMVGTWCKLEHWSRSCHHYSTSMGISKLGFRGVCKTKKLLKYRGEDEGSVTNIYAFKEEKGEMLQLRYSCRVLFWHSQAWVLLLFFTRIPFRAVWWP